MKYFEENKQVAMVDIFTAIKYITDIEKVLHEVKRTSCEFFIFDISYFSEKRIHIKTHITDDLDSYSQEYNVIATLQDVAFVYADDIIKKLEDRASYIKNYEKYRTL